MEDDKITNRLSTIKYSLTYLEFKKSIKITNRLFDQYIKSKEVDMKILLQIEKEFISEFSLRDPSYLQGFKILNEIFVPAYHHILKSGKDINLLDDENERLSSIELSLGVIHNELKKYNKPIFRGSKKNFMLLLCLGHLLRYEFYTSSSGFIRLKLKTLIVRGSKMKKKEIEERIEDYITIKLQGSDGKADVTHIRNSIAHGRFSFIKENFIQFQDQSGGVITFDRHLNDGDLVGLFNMFEIKIQFIMLYFQYIQLLYDLRNEKVAVKS